ncbi:hypothetical protein GCM10027280_26530 [Micromonospora polyrhachis]|uniref:Uncharacterized protein n=1 Tax=Micromonospora polyrhachis TaxID=1282883 RepID=A0A7W7SN03_9ACTN|nr:hypothetical protein [Micromonospora polyrhachis]MBB4957748.1 hypothetical protein [Micromonospora polyrhachis]
MAQICHERHLFRFHDRRHLAVYLATTPRHQFGGASVDQIARRLRRRQSDQSVTMNSTVSYLIGVRR